MTSVSAAKVDLIRGNPCHSAAFNTLAALRHKVSFIGEPG